MDIVADSPTHELILAAFRRREFPAALSAINAALERAPRDPWLLVKKGEVLTSLGRHADAVGLLKRERRERPQNVTIAVALARSYQARGEYPGADAQFAAVLEQNPGHPMALRGRIDTALALGDPHLALERSEQALARIPGDPALREQRGTILQRLHRAAEAAELFQALVHEQPHRPFLRLRLASALRLSGDPAASARICEQMLQHEPGNRLALVNMIESTLAANDLEGALRWCDAALQHLPGDLEVQRQRARVLLAAGRATEVVAALEALQAAAPDDIPLALERARACQLAGKAVEAEALLSGILRQQPRHLGAALALADLAEKARNLSGALAILESTLADRPDALSRAEPPLLLRFLELAHLAGDARRTQRALAAAQTLQHEGNLSRWTEPQLLRLTRAAEATGQQALAAEAIRPLMGREHLQPDTALFLLRKAHSTGDPALTARLGEALAERVPPGCRTYPIEAALICQGPEVAYRLARVTLAAPRQPADVALLARLMTQTGRNPLAMRYLSLCLRARPMAVDLRRLFAEACLRSGRADQLAALLDALEASGQSSEAAVLRLRLLLETGSLEQAHALASEREAQGAFTGMGNTQRLQLCLSLGRLKEAETLAALRVISTEQGSMLNELRLHQIEVQAGESEAVLAERFVFPAQQIVARWLNQPQPAKPPPAGSAPAIPRQIMQYWDKADPPEELSMVMRSWQKPPDFAYTQLDRLRALDFLENEYGRDHVRAFRLASGAAMESDFLGLCWLLAKGGIYADADDKLVGDPAALLPAGAGLVVIRSPWGAIANNLICAAAGHPVLQWAVEVACKALLQGDDESPWFKTGPGLLTRAVATYLSRTSTADERGGLCIRERHTVYPIVQMHLSLSYKSTPRHWNAVVRGSSSELRNALSGFRPAPARQAAA